MGTVVLRRIERMKQVMDNGAMVYIFPDRAIGFDRTFALTPWKESEGDMRTYFTDRFPLQLRDSHPLNIIYKNSNGVWVNILKLHDAYPTADPYAIATSHGHLFPFPVKDIPPVEYTDGEGAIYKIDQCDGDPGDMLAEIIIDEKDPAKVAISQFSLQDPLMAFSLRHLMQDLKVVVPTGNTGNFLVWLNGVFVPIMKDADGHTFYIRDAKPILSTWHYDQNSGGAKAFRTNSATIEEDPTFDRIKYRIDLRIFQWENVKVDTWALPTGVRAKNIEASSGKFVSVVDELLFDTPIADSHLVMVDGMVLAEDAYYVDPKNRRRVYLLNTITEATLLIREFLTDGQPNPEYRARRILSHKQYAIVNFHHTDPTKEIYLNRSRNNSPGFPYAREITFDKVSPHALVLVDGAYVPYIWSHRHTVLLPSWFWSNPKQDKEAMDSSPVERISFHEVV